MRRSKALSVWLSVCLSFCRASTVFLSVYLSSYLSKPVPFRAVCPARRRRDDDDDDDGSWIAPTRRKHGYKKWLKQTRGRLARRRDEKVRDDCWPNSPHHAVLIVHIADMDCPTWPAAGTRRW
eukprot:SAG22_NODE_1728_length_3710_cov_1.760731_3_plen_123_part_00